MANISSLPHWFFFSILLLTITTLKTPALVHSQCLDDQKTLLLEMKSELIFNSSLSRKLVRWNLTNDCCNWDGVECDAAGRVIGLQLDEEAISGGIDDSSSLFRLRYLEKLNLAYNLINGTQIPRGIRHLTYLTHLNLSYAGFGGNVPLELSFLRRLVILDISSYWESERLSLKLEHPSFKMMIRNLTRLREVYLDGVDISAGGSEWFQLISSSLPHLRVLSLRDCKLSGPLDPSRLQLHSLSVLRLDWNDLFTTIPDYFANFSSLTTLSLQDCSLRGSFPNMIWQVPTLQELDLSYNELLSGTIPQFPLSRAFRSIDMFGCSFSGPIPSTLGNLTELIDLDLSDNLLTGLIPSFYMSKKLKSIGLDGNSLVGSLSDHHFEGLSNLAFLNLRYNSLCGSIPLSFFGLPSLQVLGLSNNQFSGQVDEFLILNISNLFHLDLTNNQLEGPIPDSFFQLQSLETLYLFDNLFNGTFQLEKLQRLPNLRGLGLSYNNLSVDATNINSSSHGFPKLYQLRLASCNLCDVPAFIKQSSLEILDLSNNRIAGDIPSWIWEIGNGTLYELNISCNMLEDLQKPYHIPTSLVVLDLHSNQLHGELPRLPQRARYVDYSNNYFHQPIPPTFFRNVSSHFDFLSLANNSLSGAISTSLCKAISLEVLDLSFNHFSNTIPACVVEKFENLQVLNLRGNNINGVIPNQISINCNLRTLDLSNNNLGGKISKSLANCKSLAVLNVGYNKFDDSFPCMLPPTLRVLVLRSNRFHGDLRCDKSWPNLQIVDISSNNFSGNLYPLNFSTWKGMMLESDAHLRPNRSDSNFLTPNLYYRDEVTLTVKGLEMKLVKIWPDFTSIDLSCNNFQGDIPDAIGNLSSLYLLNLSHNALTATIPKSLGTLTELESLDLSFNQLRGRIPNEIARLTFLSFLNL